MITYILLTLTFVIELFSALCFSILTISHYLRNVVIANSITLTIAFWACLAPQASPNWGFFNLCVHLINSFLALSLFAIVDFEFQYEDVWIPCVYNIAYWFLNMIVEVSSGFEIYGPMMFWNER